jgi:anti-sigma factor RsiW
MNPCPRNRQPLAWLALNSLPAPETAALRAHLEACAGCRRYFVEISSVKT